MRNRIRSILIDRKLTANHRTGIKQLRRHDAYAIAIALFQSLLSPLLAQDQTPPEIEQKQLDALTPTTQRRFEELKIWGLAIAAKRFFRLLLLLIRIFRLPEKIQR
jgi:hypothetical protein